MGVVMALLVPLAQTAKKVSPATGEPEGRAMELEAELLDPLYVAI